MLLHIAPFIWGLWSFFCARLWIDWIMKRVVIRALSWIFSWLHVRGCFSSTIILYSNIPFIIFFNFLYFFSQIYLQVMIIFISFALVNTLNELLIIFLDLLSNNELIIRRKLYIKAKVRKHKSRIEKIYTIFVRFCLSAKSRVLLRLIITVI